MEITTIRPCIIFETLCLISVKCLVSKTRAYCPEACYKCKPLVTNLPTLPNPPGQDRPSSDCWLCGHFLSRGSRISSVSFFHLQLQGKVSDFILEAGGPCSLVELVQLSSLHLKGRVSGQKAGSRGVTTCEPPVSKGLKFTMSVHVPAWKFLSSSSVIVVSRWSFCMRYQTVQKIILCL